MPKSIAEITNPDDWADLTVYPWGLENRVVTGFQVLLEALARRLSTPRGGLFYDLSYGFDIRQFLNARINEENKYKLIVGVELECLQDPRVLGGIIEINTHTRDQIILDIQITSTLGPWRGVIQADKAGVVLNVA